MDGLPKLQARIDSLADLQGLMRAMRAMAASHVQEAQAALSGIRQYTEVIEDAIAEGVSLLAPGQLHAPEEQGPDDVLLLICSEHGFVGGFNEQLIESAMAGLGSGRQLAVVGLRGSELLLERGLEVAWRESMATRVPGVPVVSRRVAARLAGASGVEVIFGAYRRGGRYEIETRRILPLSKELLERASSRSSPLHHLPANVLLHRLADEYLLAELSRAMMESLASENAARLQVIEAANRNIDDRLQHLHGQALTLRQQSITTELLDLITGTEASG